MNITRELTLKLLEESPSFREFAAFELTRIQTVAEHNSALRNDICRVLEENRGNKIASIKYVRSTYSSEDIKSAFPEYKADFFDKGIGLKEAKEFVEWYIEKTS